MSDGESVDKCRGCREDIGHDEVYVAVGFRFNSHGIELGDQQRENGLYHHECLLGELSLANRSRFDAAVDRDHLNWLLDDEGVRRV